MMPQAHIGGERAGRFWELVGPVDPRRVLLVGVDVSKSSWFALCSDLSGEVVFDGVKVLADAAGLTQLTGLIADARHRRGAEVVVVGVEATGHFHQTLTAHLVDVAGVIVRVVNPAAVTAVRKARLNRRRKTDWLDAAAICELLRRGEGSPSHLDESAASTLRVLWSGRKDLVDMRSDLRHRAHALIDCLWPGLTAKDRAAGLRPLFRDPFDIKAARVIVGLLAEGWAPADFAAAQIEPLRAVFAGRGCRLVRPHAQRIISRANTVLAPDPAATAGKARILRALLASMDDLERAHRRHRGRDGIPAPMHAGRQADPDPRRRRRRRQRLRRLHRPHRPMERVVEGLARGRTRPRAQPVRAARQRLRHQP